MVAVAVAVVLKLVDLAEVVEETKVEMYQVHNLLNQIQELIIMEIMEDQVIEVLEEVVLEQMEVVDLAVLEVQDVM